MRIDPGDEVVGFPALVMRDLMRKKVFRREAVIDVLKVDEPEADRVIAALVAEKYICPCPKAKGKDGVVPWQTTPKGTRLGNASTLPAITRSEATKILEKFMAAVKAVARDDRFMFEVSEVILFGSYLAGAATVNDIDVIVKLRGKENFGEPYTDVLKAKLAKTPSFKTPTALLAHWRQEAVRFLESISPYVAFHREDTFKLIEHAARIEAQYGGSSGIVHDTTHKIIYRAPPRKKQAR